MTKAKKKAEKKILKLKIKFEINTLNQIDNDFNYNNKLIRQF